jgi:hypothetical protein
MINLSAFSHSARTLSRLSRAPSEQFFHFDVHDVQVIRRNQLIKKENRCRDIEDVESNGAAASKPRERGSAHVQLLGRSAQHGWRPVRARRRRQDRCQAFVPLTVL